MKNLFRRRPLAFEQMEQRLALSATSIGDYILTLNSVDWRVPLVQGGAVSFDQVLTSGLGGTRDTFFSYDSTGLILDRGFVDIRDGGIIFIGPVFAKPDPGGPLATNEAGSSVTPIPQPNIGKGEIAQGLIAVAEIFRPTNSSVPASVDQPMVENRAVETTVARATDDSWKSVALSRGRDVYFEVAALSDEHDAREANGPDLSTQMAPLIYQQTLERREAERASATTSQERSNPPRHGTPLPTDRSQDALPAETIQPEAPADDTAVEKSQRTAERHEHPREDVFSQIAETHDLVLAAWNDGEERGDEAIALRSETQPSRGATWPVLAALAATGWMARTRRSKGMLPSQRLPLRRK